MQEKKTQHPSLDSEYETMHENQTKERKTHTKEIKFKRISQCAGWETNTLSAFYRCDFKTSRVTVLCYE